MWLNTNAPRQAASLHGARLTNYYDDAASTSCYKSLVALFNAAASSTRFDPLNRQRERRRAGGVDRCQRPKTSCQLARSQIDQLLCRCRQHKLVQVACSHLQCRRLVDPIRPPTEALLVHVAGVCCAGLRRAGEAGSAHTYCRTSLRHEDQRRRHARRLDWPKSGKSACGGACRRHGDDNEFNG